MKRVDQYGDAVATVMSRENCKGERTKLKRYLHRHKARSRLLWRIYANRDVSESRECDAARSAPISCYRAIFILISRSRSMTSRFDQKTFCSARVPKISIAKTFDYRRPLFIRNSMKNLARNSVVW